MPIPQVATEALRDGMMRFDSGSREGETVAIRLLARRKSTFTRIVQRLLGNNPKDDTSQITNQLNLLAY
jgi:hypothetical protein